MANCPRCGRELPSFSLGDLPELCSNCRSQAATTAHAPAIDGAFSITALIIAINAGLFALMTLSGVPLSGGSPQQLVRWGADYGPLTLGGQWWRPLTSTFVHIGIVHLGVNMWCFWDLGRLAESQFGKTKFALIYLATGFLAGLASLMWHPRGVSAGASGALFGIAGALIAALRLGAVSIPPEEIKHQMKSLVPFCAYNLILGALMPHIDNAAHVGGFLAGLGSGAWLAFSARQNRPATPSG